MRKIALAAGIIALALLAWLFVDKCVLVVKNVAVEGAYDGDADDIIRLSGIEFNGSLRKMDMQKTAMNVESSGKYRCIDAEKDYPSGVTIKIAPRKAVCVIESGGFMVTLDDGGYVMDVSNAMPEGAIVYVTGVEARKWELGRQITADAARLDALISTVRAINNNGAQDYVSEVNVSGKNSLYAYSRTGIYVLLGDMQDMDRKILWMKHALADLESRGETSGRLDVSSGDKADFSAGDM